MGKNAGKSKWCILHVCGGDPDLMQRFGTDIVVFSTYVEVIPNAKEAEILEVGILHVCGGDPQSQVVDENAIQYSPRMWR